MQMVWKFMKTTMIGGILFLIPFIVLALVLSKAIEIFYQIVEPISNKLSFESVFGGWGTLILAIFLLTAFCFCAGRLARTKVAAQLVEHLERTVLSKIPGYRILKNAGEDLIDSNIGSGHLAVLVRLDDGWQLGFKVESINNGELVAVFIPDSPTPQSGSVLIVTADRVKDTNVSIVAALACIKNYGVGLDAIFAKIEN